MRNLVTIVSATLTAVLIGLLIANVASAARAAEIAHEKDQQIAAIQESYSASDLNSQLDAYRTRYAEAYKQLSSAYQALAARDAEYRTALDRANTTSGQLAGANASLDAKLTDAYRALRDAQAQLAALQSGPAAAPRSNSNSRPATTPPSAPTQYCRYDAEGKWVCEDHPLDD